MNFPFICSNIPAAPTYGVYITQLIRYSRACDSYHDFLDRGMLLTRKLLNQGFLLFKLKSWLGWPLWNICVTNDHGHVPPVVSTTRSFPHSWRITGFVTILTRRVPLVEHELLNLPEHLSSPPILVRSCYSIFSFMCMFCRSLFVLLYFFFCPLCCLFFFDIRILITPLVSSIFS